MNKQEWGVLPDPAYKKLLRLKSSEAEGFIVGRT